MNRTIACSVGTSLLTNRNRPWEGWKAQSALPPASEVDAWLSSADRAAASAETNTLRLLDVDEGDILVFLHSNTPEGQFCAERLQSLYDGECRETRLEKIRALGYGCEHFTGGLKGLIDVALGVIREARERGRETLFCATGGFKAEIATLNLLGALLEIEVVYLHELHRELVRLPRLPLAWDHEFARRHADFFAWIDAEPRPSVEVESRLKAHPELRTLLEDGGDGNTYLTAAGDEWRPRAVWPPPDPRPPEEKSKVSDVPHHRPPGWERFVRRLCTIDCVSLVRYDESAHGGERAKILDPDLGAIGLRFGPPGGALPLRVETTARGVAQSELVASYLRGLR